MPRISPKLLAFLGVLIVMLIAYSALSSRFSFDPTEIARSEVRMWQAYYDGDPRALHSELVDLLKQQFGVSTPKAMLIAKDLASAAIKFRQANSNYESIALPDLESAYSQLEQSLGGGFDPKAAAQAELAWWVARRTPGQDSTEEVGQLIGHFYAVLYGTEAPEFIRAGVLSTTFLKYDDVSL